MPDVAKLKKKAAELELKKQFDKALAVYVEILQGYDDSDDEVDVALYNRVGDLYLKQGSVADAVDYYEQAVDRYAEGGFFNNAIALCNKILRNSPGRTSVYYKLGKISAQKGFKSDAKANFLEYADRMQRAGHVDEAFRALKEFADLCPDQDDIRLLLAEQLSKQERGPEAIEQLQQLYERYSQEGRDLEARATIDRMRAIDPSIQPRTSGAMRRPAGADLVFLDLNDGRAERRSQIAKRATHGLEIIHTGEYQEVDASAPPPAPAPSVAATPAPTPELLDTPALDPALLDGVTRAAEFELADETGGDSSPLDGLQTLELDVDDAPPRDQPGMLLDLEPTSLEAPLTERPTPAPRVAAPGLSDDELLDFQLPGARPTVDDAGRAAQPLPEIELAEPHDRHQPAEIELDDSGAASRVDDDEPSIGGELSFILPDDDAPDSESGAHGDIPLLMDLDLPVAGEATASIAGTAEGDSPDTGTFALPTPPASRRSTMVAEQSVELLQALMEAQPDDHEQRRRLAEAMLDAGDREGGLRELERAMVGFEREEQLSSAASVADEIVRLNPESVRHHQKRVEYSFRTNERGRLIEAYLALADALFRAGQLEKSRAILQRVLDLAPDDLRAQAALENFPAPDAPPSPPTATSPTPHAAIPAAARPSAAPRPDEQFINLGDWLRDDDAPKDTRMVVEEREPSGDEEADFQDMLRKFKQGIAENVEEEDHQSHYDLGIAYKEMGLLDEAIAQFQKSLRSPVNRVPSYEALGQCFMEKEQYPMAATILGRALQEKGVSDDKLVGVLYLLGQCAETRGQLGQAADYYQRVFVVDIQFRDVGERLAAVEGASS